MIPPAHGWRHKGRIIRNCRLSLPFTGLSIVLVALGVTVFRPNPGLQLGLIVTAMIILVVLARNIRIDLFTPLSHLRNWALRMRSGNLNARLPLPSHGEFAHLASDINSLSENLQSLSQDMEVEIRKQTRRIEQKNRSLRILYEVAANINEARDVDDLLSRFLEILMEALDAQAGTIRLLTEDNQMRLVASAGLDENIVKEELLVPVDRCFCGTALTEKTAVCQQDVTGCERFVGQPLLSDSNVELVSVPVDYQGRHLGVFNLFVNSEGSLVREDMQEILTSIGRHLGMAIEKVRLDDEAQRLSIVEERNLLAHELHDSLAQTLASIRFQVSTLEDSLSTWSTVSSSEVRQLRNVVEEANQELRELLAHFRTPMDERGLIPALKDVINAFRTRSQILVFLQDEWQHATLPASMELQVLRIVQEALSNIRKHSDARAVRILLRHRPGNEYLVMVEDDGIGLPDNISAKHTHPGEHIGMSIMRERAQKLHGELIIESEPAEGTRLTLSFKYPLQEETPEVIVRAAQEPM
jgi:two-component system nitrate/nitrite sensor histidine kinase NarX